MSERGEPGHVGRVQRVSAGGDVVESGLGVHRLPQHDYVDHDAEAVELVFLPDLVVPPDLAALAVEDVPGEGVAAFPADLAVLSPYVTARIQRFGVYATDEIALTPEPFNAHLGIDLAAAS